MLELIVALTVLGIALAGLFPLAVQYSRQVKKLEDCNPQTGRWGYNDGQKKYTTYAPSDPLGKYPDQWYLNPSSDAWAQKLCAAALLSDGAAPMAATPAPNYDSTTRTVFADDSTSGYFGFYPDNSGWTAASVGYADTCWHHASGTATGAYACWTFKNVPFGRYVVEAIWPDPTGVTLTKRDGSTEGPTLSACYAIYDYGADGNAISSQPSWQGVCGQPALNASNGDFSGGYYWMPITTAYVRSTSAPGGANTVEVHLMSTATSGFTTSDAVRLVPVLSVLSLTRTMDGKSVSATVSVKQTP